MKLYWYYSGLRGFFYFLPRKRWDLIMKYTIEGFNQSEALNFKDVINGKIVQIDVTDLAILRWIVDFYPRMSKIEINGAQYVWISYKAILNDMPLLDIKKVALANRLKKMVHFGILNFELVQNGNTYTYYSFGNNYMNLISTPVTQTTTPCHLNDNPLSFERHPPCHLNDNHNNSSIIDTSINQSIINNKTNATKVADVVEFNFDEMGAETTQAVKDWIEYRRSIKKPIKTQVQMDNLRKQLWGIHKGSCDGVNKMRLAIQHSISNGYQGLFEAKYTAAQQRLLDKKQQLDDYLDEVLEMVEPK